MKASTPAFSARLRNYVTLTFHFIPLVGIGALALDDFKLRILLLLLLFLLGSIGPALELLQKSVGRSLTLTALGFETAAIFAFASFVAYEGGFRTLTLGGRDFSLIVFLLLPGFLFVWNFIGGRGPRQIAPE